MNQSSNPVLFMTATQLFNKVKNDFETARVLFPEAKTLKELVRLVSDLSGAQPDSVFYATLDSSLFTIYGEIGVDDNTPLDLVTEETRKAWDFDMEVVMIP